VGGPLRIIWWSAKHKILICIGIRGPLQLVVRGADFGNVLHIEKKIKTDVSMKNVHEILHGMVQYAYSARLLIGSLWAGSKVITLIV